MDMSMDMVDIITKNLPSLGIDRGALRLPKNFVFIIVFILVHWPKAWAMTEAGQIPWSLIGKFHERPDTFSNQTLLNFFKVSQPTQNFLNPRLIELQYKITEILAKAPEAHWGVEVVSLNTGEDIYSHQALKLFRPASTQKILTSAYALDSLSEHFQFKTFLFKSEGKEELVLRGEGDPALYGAKKERWLQQLVQYLIQHSNSGQEIKLRVEGGNFPEDAFQPRWMLEDYGQCYGAPVSPLQFDKNCQKVLLHMDHLGQLTSELIPYPLSRSLILNLDISPGPGPSIGVFSPPISKQVFIKGKMKKGTHTEIEFPMPSPLDTFHEILERELQTRLGLYHRRISLEPIEYQETREDLLETWSSGESLIDWAKVLLKDSQNLYAETFLLRAAMENKGKKLQERSESLNYFKKYLTQIIGVSVSDLYLEDGSGVSHFNNLRPHDLTEVLKHIYANKDRFAFFKNSLPLAGVDGTLKNRMNTGYAYKNVRAKTGTLTRVSALSGFVSTLDDEDFAFSIVANNFASGSAEIRSLQDEICELMASFSRLP